MYVCTYVCMYVCVYVCMYVCMYVHMYVCMYVSDHRMVMGSITLNTRAERRKLLNKNTRTRVDTQMIGTKKNTFQLELKNRFTALEEHDDMDSLNKNMTEMNQQSALSIAKQTKKQKNPKISAPTRALMKKRREMIENKTPETT